MARRAVASAVTWAAKGVDLRLPLKPWAPAEPQATTLPVASVIEMIVLLNVDWMWAWPTTTFLRSRRLVLTAFFFCLANWNSYFVFFRRMPTVRFGPRRPRAFVRVRWPRTGRPRRCRRPR